MTINILNILGWKPWMIILCVGLAVWDLIRKGIALYKAGQKSHIVRFIFIFIFNTCGILPIIYLVLNWDKNK